MTTLYMSYPIPTREQWFLNVTNDLRENHFLENNHEIPTDVKSLAGFLQGMPEQERTNL